MEKIGFLNIHIRVQTSKLDFTKFYEIQNSTNSACKKMSYQGNQVQILIEFIY